MHRASEIRAAGTWNPTTAIDRVVLDADERHRRRIMLTGERGIQFLLDLPHAAALHDGDGLVLEDGALVRVAGKPESLIEISAASAHELARLGTLAIVTPMWRSSAIVCASAGTTCWKTCCAVSAPSSPRSRRRSIRNRAPMDRNIRTATTMLTRSKPDAAPAAAREALSEGTPYALDPRALYRLMTWLSPAYPIGAFSYSGGIEWSVEAGDIRDAATLQSWLTVMIADGGGYCDGVFFAHAYRAAAHGDDAALRAVAELAAAFAQRRRAAPSSIQHARRGPRARSIGSRRSPMAPSRFPSRSLSRAPGTALHFPLPFIVMCTRLRRISSRAGCA
jgi:hypothetical protein